MRSVIAGCVLMFVVVAAAGQTKPEETLSFTSPRPIRDAIVDFEKKYGWVITYEEPRFQFSGDMEDLAQSARLQGKSIAPDKQFRVPKSRTVSVTYQRPTNPANPTSRLQVVQTILDAYAHGEGDTFEIRETASRLHIVPGLVRNTSGQLQHQAPVFDAVISITDDSRDGLQFLEDFCEQLSSAVGIKVVTGTVPTNALARYQTKRGFASLSARDALEQFLDGMPNGARYSWRLLYGDLPPSGLSYVLNINWVPDRTAPPVSASQTPNHPKIERPGVRILMPADASGSSGPANTAPK
ncbi:MAG: hypothetical protein LAO09_12705 [Acidobacteriia bacterium]|nr:hypothetical protein [Terriglobia bacterium]